MKTQKEATKIEDPPANWFQASRALAPNKPTSEIADQKMNTTNRNIEVRLGTAYFNQGFFNIPVSHDNLIDKHGASMEFYLGNSTPAIHGKINRTANTNETARIMGGKDVKNWIQNRFSKGDKITLEILGPNSVRLSDKNSTRKSS